MTLEVSVELIHSVFEHSHHRTRLRDGRFRGRITHLRP